MGSPRSLFLSVEPTFADAGCALSFSSLGALPFSRPYKTLKMIIKINTSIYMTVSQVHFTLFSPLQLPLKDPDILDTKSDCFYHRWERFVPKNKTVINEILRVKSVIN